MYRIAYGKLKPSKIHDFVDWFTNEEKLNKLKAVLPAGVTYLGTKLVDMGDADHDFEFWYEIPNYGALDSMDTKNPAMKGYLEELISTLGFFGDSFKVKFLRDVNDVVLLDRSVIEGAIKKEKEA